MSNQRPPAALRLRCATAADLDACAVVIRAAVRADGVSQVETRDTLAHDLAHADQLGDAVLGVAEQDDNVVGFHRLGWFQQPDGLEVYTHRGHVLPEARGQGVGSALVLRAEQQLIALATRRATPNPKRLSAWYYEDEAGIASLLSERGYERHRDMLEMQHDLQNIPEHPLPNELDVRPVQPEHLRAIWEAYIAFSADEISSVIDTPEGFNAWSTLPQWDNKLWLIAWQGWEVMGLALSYQQEHLTGDGYIEFVGVRKSWRRQGLAHALLARSLQELKSRGAQLVQLDVVPDNAFDAYQLYTGMGFKCGRKVAITRRGLRHL